MNKLVNIGIRKDALALLLLLGLALSVKLLHLGGMAVGQPLRADALQYTQTAINIAERGIFADKASDDLLSVNRLPGYPLLLSPIWYLSQDVRLFYHYALLFNVVLGLLSVALMYKIARSFLSIAAAAALSILLIFNPHVLAMEGYVLTETLFLFEMLSLIWMVSLAIRTQRSIAWVAAGVIVGFSLLTRPSFILFLPFAALLIYLTKADRKVHLNLLAKGGLGMLVATAPWLLYTQVHDVPFTGTKADAVTFAAGFYPNFVYQDPRYYGYPYRDPAAPDIHYDKRKALKQLARWVRDDPVKYLSWFLIGKPMALWQWKTVQGQGDFFIYPVTRSVFYDNGFFRTVAALYKHIYPVMLVLMLVGLVHVMISRSDILMLYIAAIVLYFIAIHIVFFSLPRYSVPIRPMMLFLDAYAIKWIYQYYSALRGRKDGVSG